MSFVFSKNKEKRSRSSTGESNSSFVKNVTSRVSGLLPAGITKWFSSPSSSSANGSAAVADGTDSSTEDEAPESPILLQPPAKRLRYSSPVGKYSQLTTTETTLTSNVITETGSVLYNSIQSPPGQHTFRRETNFNSTPIRAHSEDLNMKSVIERTDRDNSHKQHTVSAIGHSIALKRKSLFDSERQKEQSLIACSKSAAHQVKDPKAPYFKPHLLGSPFYHGRTMYGGAAASSSYMSEPNVKQRKMTHVNVSKDADTVNMSSSSRRVMDLLENYSSPLIEAKRIPRYELSELTDINRSIQPSTSTSNRLTHKTQELYIPSTASVIRMKARSRLMDSTKAARQIIASHSSTLSSFQPYQHYAVDASKRDQPDNESGPGKSQSKLKSRLTRSNRGEDPFGLPEAVDLPNATLQIDKNNLPKFSFEVSIRNPTPTSTASNETFKFSSPQPVSSPDLYTPSVPPPSFDFGGPEKGAVNTSPSNFSFGLQSRESTMKPRLEKKDESAKSQSTEKSVITYAKGSSDWKCSDCWVSNKTDVQKCACCGAAKQAKQTAATAIKSASKCTKCKLSNSQPNSDKCVNCEKMQSTLQTTNNSSPITKAVTTSKWKCGDCWVDNEESAERCICCGSRNTKKSSSPAVVVSNNKVPATNTVEKDWRCEDCLVTNKPNIEKCVACGGSKPGNTKPAVKTLPSIASSIIFKDTNNKLGDIMKSQKSSWECRVCLASNANDISTCVCCDADKDVKDNAAPKFTNFKFNSEPNPGFKFGIDPKVQESNLAQKVDENPKNSEESETNNNIVPKTPSFTFQLPAKKSGDKLDGPKTDEAPKPSFSFGIPKQNTTPTATSVVSVNVSSPTKLPDIVKPAEEKEKPQEVPSISFNAPGITKPSMGLFSSPATSNPQNAMNAFINNSEEKMSLSSDKTLPSAVQETSKPQFSFSALKPSTGGLFTSPASTVASNSLNAQASPATNLIMGMFPKPDTTAAPAVPSFFSKLETKPAPAPVPALAPAAAPEPPAPAPLFQNSMQSSEPSAAQTSAVPMFSFGTSQSASAAPAPFSFSAATTPAFGASSQTNTNTFGMPTTNPLTNGPGNPLGGNPLGGTGGNGLPASGNTLLGSGSTSMFNAPAKENTSMWPNNSEQTNQSSPFMTSTPMKPAFSFGATPAPSPFGAQANNAQTHIFGANVQPAQNMFGMNQNNAGQPSMFSSPAASQPMFGSAQATNPGPSMGMFGAPSASPFGAPNPSMPSFEAPAPSPAFNFGAPQATPGVFGFGQQPQQTQPQQMQPQQMQPQQMQHMQQPGMQAGMYNFGGAAPAAAGQVQFNMGSAPSATAGRRVRKAVRRNPQR